MHKHKQINIRQQTGRVPETNPIHKLTKRKKLVDYRTIGFTLEQWNNSMDSL